MNRRLILLVTFLVLSLLSYIVYTIYIDNGEAIDLDESAQQVINDVEKVKKQQEVYDWIPTSDIEGGYLDVHIHEIAERHKDPKNVIEFLFGTIILKDTDLFIQSFDTETISKDLFSNENPNKTEVTADFINQISRSGKLDRVGVINVSGSIGQEITVRIALGYSDGLQIKVPIKMKLSEDAHGDDHAIYFITTSILEIIEKINE